MKWYRRDGVGVTDWYRRDGVGVPLFAEAKSGTPTPSLLYQSVTPTPSPCSNLVHQPRPSCTTIRLRTEWS
ncbi:MAG: hypothetical protein FWE41_07895 [Coriobacteriia bacterium]|nr:hypothetical protein [Coriobacteriia bacterium]MCL2750939.1 hypothetical protein [Coriobacteriia bacterium]